MKSFDINKNDRIETPENVVNFLNDLGEICKKYNLSIAHEDSQGSFVLETYDDYNVSWVRSAMLDLREKTEEDL